MTFKSAKEGIMRELEARGWSLSRALKIPHATSPDKRLRLWFKAQSIYFTIEEHTFGAARAITYWGWGVREMSPAAYVDFVETRLGR